MTRKVSLWTMLLITFTIISTFSINLYISWDRNLQSKYGEVKSISNLLDQQFEKASLKILTQPNLSDSEKIAALNKELQPIVDNIVSSHPNYGGGYYVKQLNSIVAFGPNFEKNGLKDLSTDSKARNVYITAEDVKFYNYSQTRNGYVVANIHPLIRDNEVIGHTWGNVLIEDVFTMFKKDIENLLLVLIVMLIIAFFGSRAITKQYISNISIFKKYILEDKPLPANIRFSKELYEVYIAYSNSRSLQKQQEESIRQLAYFDQLTHLPNRTSLYINLNSSIAKDEPFALLFVDVDEFKSVNDTQGHHIGDQLLILIAK
ncbi:MAG: diguanylate cyclase, partial [Lysinibacillus sp.]